MEVEATVGWVPGTETTGPSEDQLAPFLRQPDQAAIITDFDGTLAPIVEDPGQSRPLPEAVDLLRRLGRRYGRVAVVSGRPAAFIADHLGLFDQDSQQQGLLVAGLYGLEKTEGTEVTPHPDAAEWRSVVDRVAAQAQHEAPSGVGVEHKGLSVVLHYRSAPEQEGWAGQWAEKAADETGLALHPARMSQELRPPIESDKGTAMTELVEGFRAACFIGDDLGDIPAFDALDRLAEDGGMDTLKVAVRSDESPPELLEGSDAVVDGPEGVVELFRCLL